MYFSQDSKLVIERYKSGFPIPDDAPFEDLSTGQSIEPSNNTTPHHHSAPSVVRNATVSGKSGKSRKGIFGIFSSSKV